MAKIMKGFNPNIPLKKATAKAAIVIPLLLSDTANIVGSFSQYGFP
jgi:hypothetical protein